MYKTNIENKVNEILDENIKRMVLSDYGNGLKKFEPNDLNKSKIPDLSILSQKDKKAILNHLENFKKTQDELYISKIDYIFNKRYSIK